MTLPLVGVMLRFHTHQLPLEEAPHGYEIFQKTEDGAVKALPKP